MTRKTWIETARLVAVLAAAALWALGCGETPFGVAPDDDGWGEDDDGGDDDASGDDDDASDDDTEDPCEDVVCGDHAHCEGGDCVCDDGYEGDPYDACEPIVSQEDAIRAELVEIAAAELGMCEGIDERPYMEYQPGWWCYDFVAWVYEEANEGLPYPLSLPQMYIGTMPPDWRPKPGDLVKYQIQHYGMVASLSGDEVTVYTIDGNGSSCVMERSTTDASVGYYGTLEDFVATLQ